MVLMGLSMSYLVKEVRLWENPYFQKQENVGVVAYTEISLLSLALGCQQ